MTDPGNRPPAARAETVREERFGVALADPYRWMEAEDAELRDWLAAQGGFAASVLAGLPGRAEILRRVAGLAGGDTRESAFQLAGDKVLWLRQDPGADVPVLVAGDEDGGQARTLLDPAKLPGDEHSYLDWFVPSPDGRHVACGISAGGSEYSTLRVLEVSTGELTGDELTGTRHGEVSWLPGGDALICHRYLDAAPGTPPDQRRLDSRSVLHRLGAATAADQVVLARGVSQRVPLDPVDRPFVLLPAGSDWMVAAISHSALAGPIGEEMSDCSLYVAPRAALADPARCPWRLVARPEDGVISFAVHGGELYLVTYRDAPRCQVLSVPMADPDVSAATVVLPPGERAIASVLVAGDQLLVHERDGGISRIRQVPLRGGPAREVQLPVDGALAQWAAHPSRPEILLTLSSWTTAPAVYRYDAAAGTITATGWQQATPPGFTGLVSSDLRVPARDGTLIPLRVLHRDGLALDGGNPAILAGYGSFGYVPRELFEPYLLAWCERGGVWAMAGLRGGGEYGREWHEAGLGARKENTITDFIDCAEFLIGQGYTGPAHLAGHGGSAGAIPVGSAMVRRPELWSAMVLEVPAINMTRMEFSENGPVNAPEFGSVSTETGLRDLLLIDSYLQVRDGERYPAVLLTAGLNDLRVAAWQPAKMTARLQAATGSGRQVLLRVDPHAGHGFGSTQAQRDQLTADILAFLWHELASSQPAAPDG
ncbi:MAG TPA: prolyl oligopeptidase family serine peptidase [Streptosporangiaceae bacterium]